MKLSMTQTFMQWVPMIPVGNGESVINIRDANIGQVRTYREDLRKRIDRLNQTAVALDYLLVSARSDAEDAVTLDAHLRQQHPEEFDDE